MPSDKEKPKATSAEPLEVTAPGLPQPKQPAKGSNGRSAERVVTVGGGGGARRKATKGGGKKKTKASRSNSKSSPKPAEKLPAERVLLDPRLRVTRSILFSTCGMTKELDAYDKKFDEETKKKGKARNCSDSSSDDRGGEDEREEKMKKKKKKKDECVRESFLNVNEADADYKKQQSPNAKSPEASTPMIEEMDFDLRVMELTHVKKLTVWKLASVLMSNFFRLPIFLVVTKFYVTYGASFIGVCGLMMLAVGIPAVYLELSMGQFTSLPPNTFFARISPIARGVGISMILLRLFSMFCIHVDFRYLFLFFQGLALASTKTDTRCATAGMPFCHTDSMCPEGEVPGLYGACLKPSTKDVAFKDSVLTEVMRIRALQTSPIQLLVDNELAEHNVYAIFTHALIFVVAGIPLIDGAELFATLAPLLLFISFLTPAVIGFSLTMVDGPGFFRAGWNGDMDGFSDPFAWIVAFCLICSMFNIGEGTWMFIGSWMGFRNSHIRRALLYAVGCQLLLMFLLSYVFTAWAVGVVNYQHNGYLTHRETLEILRDRPLEFWLQLPIKMFPDKQGNFMYLAYLLFTLCSLGYVITTGEYLLVSMLRAFPFLVRMNRVKLRGLALLVLTGVSSFLVPFLMDAHIFKTAKVHYAYIAMQMVVILYEFTVFVYIYGIQRVLVNLKVILRNETKTLIMFSRATPYLKLCYRYIIMWLVFLGFGYSTHYIDVNSYSLMSCLYLSVPLAPFIIGLYKVARHSETTHSLVTLFRADARFGPSAVADRKMAATEENKMGAAGLE